MNGFLVYLYDGPRVPGESINEKFKNPPFLTRNYFFIPEFDRPGVANVDKIKAGRTSWIARRTESRGGRIRMAKYRAMFSTSVIGSSTNWPG